MLTELKIRNFAIIDELHVSFTGGLNMLSGETGAGKSIIIGAVSLLLGDRASSDLVRSSADAAVVEALFDVRDNAVVRERLEEAGMGEEEVLLLKRVVSREGRNKVYINGSPATLGMLASFGEVLVNICGQREHQLLLDIENHIDILDTFGGLIPLRDAFTDRYAEWQGLTKKLNGLKAQNDEKLQREELLRFQLDEIDKSDLTVGEDGALQDEKRVLSNAQRLDEYARGAYDTLYAAAGSIIEQLGGVVDHIRKISKIDPGFAITDTEVESLFFNLEESAFALRDYLNREGNYTAFYMNVETGQTARSDVGRGMKAIISEFAFQSDLTIKGGSLRDKINRYLEDYDPDAALKMVLSDICKSLSHPVVLFIDEIDALVGDTLISVLRQLRSGWSYCAV